MPQRKPGNPSVFALIGLYGIALVVLLNVFTDLEFSTRTVISLVILGGACLAILGSQLFKTARNRQSEGEDDEAFGDQASR